MFFLRFECLLIREPSKFDVAGLKLIVADERSWHVDPNVSELTTLWC